MSEYKFHVDEGYKDPLFMIPKGAIVHCSATKNGASIGDDPVKVIGEWHKKRKFNQIGYHFVIDIDGTVYPGRPMNRKGAHCLGTHPLEKFSLNQTIGICLIGTDKFYIHQFQALYDTLQALQQIPIYEMNPSVFFTHNQFSNKTCPGFSVNQLLTWLHGDWEAIRDNML